MNVVSAGSWNAVRQARQSVARASRMHDVPKCIARHALYVLFASEQTSRIRHCAACSNGMCVNELVDGWVMVPAGEYMYQWKHAATRGINGPWRIKC